MCFEPDITRELEINVDELVSQFADVCDSVFL
jgi:hypothetical protein